MTRLNLGTFSLFLVLMASNLNAAPAENYDTSIKDLYDYLLQREYAGPIPLSDHQVERKAVRSPSLRLRFGRRSDPSLPLRQFFYPNQIESEIEQKSIRSPSLRLRFGKRSDPILAAFNDNLLFDEEPMRRKPEQRSPSRRLRFGRSDPSLMSSNEVNAFPADDLAVAHSEENN